MKKNFLLLVIATFLFSGCFSLSFLNPFSDSKEDLNKKEIEVPNEAPKWLKDEKEKNCLFALGATKDVDIEDIKTYEQKALLNAGNNLTRKIYIKTVLIYKDYLEEVSKDNIFENDIKQAAKQVALKSLNQSKIKGFWENSQKELFVRIRVDSKSVAELIQENSKKVFKVDEKLYEHFLSNRALEDLIKVLEE